MPPLAARRLLRHKNSEKIRRLRQRFHPLPKGSQLAALVDFPRCYLTVRGIFDTDGQISARKDEKYRYPYIFISSSSNVLRQQLKDILRSQGITAYVYRDNVVVRGLRNFNKWLELVGSSNPRNLKRFKELQETGKLASVGS